MSRDQSLLEGLLTKVVGEINSLLEGAADRTDAVDREIPEDIHQRYADMFMSLATDGRLHVDDLHELVETVNPCINAQFTVEKGKPKIAMTRRFRTDSERWAYAMLVLAEQDGGFYVIQCKHCRSLALKKRGKPGKPSTAFCSPPAKCGNNYAQSQSREREKQKRKQARAAAKHK